MHHNTPLFDSDPTGTHHRRHPSLTIQPPTTSYYDDRASPSFPLSNNISHNSYAGALASSSTLLPPPLAFDRQSQHHHPFRSTPLDTTTTATTTLHSLSRSNGGGGGVVGGPTLLGSTPRGGHYRNFSGSSGGGSKSNMMYQQDSLGFSSALATSGGSGTTITGSPQINISTTSSLNTNTTAVRSFIELLKPHVKFVLVVLMVWIVYGSTFGEETTTMILSLFYVLFTTLPDCLLRPKWVKKFIEPLPYRVISLVAARHGVTQAILFLEFAIVMDGTIPKVSDDAFTPIWTAFGASLLIQTYLSLKVAGSASVFLRSPLFAWLMKVLCMGSGILLRNVLQCTPCCPRTTKSSFPTYNSTGGGGSSGGYSRTGSPPLTRDSSHSNFTGGGGGGSSSGQLPSAVDFSSTASLSTRLMERLGRCRLDSAEELTRQFVQLVLQPATTCTGTHSSIAALNNGGGGNKSNQHHHSCKTICGDVMVFVLPGFVATAFLHLRRVYRQGKAFIVRRFQLLLVLLLRPVLCGYHYRKRKESGGSGGASVSPASGLVVSGGHQQPNLLPSRSWSVLDVPQPVSTPLGGGGATSAVSSSFRRQPISIATGGGGGTHQPSLGTAGSSNVLSSLAYERSPLLAPPFSPTSSVFHPPPASSPRIGFGGGGGSSFFSPVGGGNGSSYCCCVDCGVKNMKSRYNRLTAFRYLTRR